MLEGNLPTNHPRNLDEMLQNPSDYKLPLGHPNFAKMMVIKNLETPSIAVYFDHPNANESFIAGWALPLGHVSMTDLLDDYLPPNHPLNLDEMIQNPSKYELPLGHPNFGATMKAENLELPSISVYFDHPNATDSFISGQALPSGHTSMSDLLVYFLPPNHPLNLDEMMQNLFNYELPLSHLDFANMMDIKALQELSIPVYFDHPNATESFMAGCAVPPRNISLTDMFQDFLPPNHPLNLKMMQNPSNYKLPLGQPDFTGMMKVENLYLPSITVYFDHPNASKSFVVGVLFHLVM